MYYTQECMNVPLLFDEKIEIVCDYMFPILSLSIVSILLDYDILKPRILKYLFYGFLLSAPFECIYTLTGYVSYIKCDTYYWAPLKYMWFIHSLWDSLLLLFLYCSTSLIYGVIQIETYPLKIPMTMSILGIIIKIYSESKQLLWNPEWTIVYGRIMPLQQLYWCILPIIYYNFIYDHNM